MRKIWEKLGNLFNICNNRREMHNSTKAVAYCFLLQIIGLFYYNFQKKVEHSHKIRVEKWKIKNGSQKF